MIKFATVVTIFATLVTAVVALISWAVTTYAPLWVQIASIPVTGWLLVIMIATLVERGVFDRWVS